MKVLNISVKKGSNFTFLLSKVSEEYHKIDSDQARFFPNFESLFFIIKWQFGINFRSSYLNQNGWPPS